MDGIKEHNKTTEKCSLYALTVLEKHMTYMISKKSYFTKPYKLYGL